jgi:pilus assembly protein CpaB
MALAIVLALAGTFAVYLYAHRADQRAVAATSANTVVYATGEIPAGTTWSDAAKSGQLATERVPVDATPSGALRSIRSGVPGGELTNSTIGAGQIIVRSMFSTRIAKTGVLQIPGHTIAVSVMLPENADVAGFVQSGSQVAIFTTFKVVPTGKSKAASDVGGGTDLYTTKLLLPRVDVLAVSQAAPSDLNGGQSSNAVSSQSTNNILVTLSLSQADAERLLLAQQMGQLYLGLLSQNSATAADAGVANVVRFAPAPIFVK